MRLPKLQRLLREIHLGDDASRSMTRAEQRRWEQRPAWKRFHAAEDGKISFVSIFTVLAFLVIVLLVTNTGITVSHKVRLQNSADSVAYSSALWQARSMNAITTANHLMGELTAMTVILDSFGGKYLGSGEEFSCKESKARCKAAKDLKGEFCKELGFAARIVHLADEPLVEMIVGDDGLMTKADGKHRAGAAIYDAKLALQFWAYFAMFVKQQANTALYLAEACYKSVLFSAFGPPIEGVAIALHVTMSVYLTKMGTEWAILDATEIIIKPLVVPNSVRDSLITIVIPAISMYSDTIVGELASTEADVSSDGFAESVRATHLQLKQIHRLSSVASYPKTENLRLPLTKEPPPQEKRGDQSQAESESRNWGYPPNEWSGDFTDPDLKNVARLYDGILSVLSPLESFAGAMKEVADLMSDIGEAVSDELKDVADVFRSVSSLLNSIANPPRSPSTDTDPSNPCVSEKVVEELRLPQFYWQEERKSQWTRATYPHVDEMRAPILGFFKKRCGLSNAATYYAKWCNRYTLAASYEIRRSQESTSQGSAETDSISELRAEVRRLRVDFNTAADGSADENAGNVQFGKFDEISKDLLKVIDQYQSSVPSLASWFEDAADHQTLVSQVSKSVDPLPESSFDQQTLEGLASELALVNVLDELLNLMEEFVDSLTLGKPHMYVMQGLIPEGKGSEEPWLTDDALAEDLFTITAYVAQSRPKIIGPVLFKNPHQDKQYAFSSVMIYNANGRSEVSPNGFTVQPNTGWDTLNWEPPVKAFEWGNNKPSKHDHAQPWDVFNQPGSANSSREHVRQNRTKVNWQVKLIPLTERRVGQIREQNEELGRTLESHELFSH